MVVTLHVQWGSARRSDICYHHSWTLTGRAEFSGMMLVTMDAWAIKGSIWKSHRFLQFVSYGPSKPLGSELSGEGWGIGKNNSLMWARKNQISVRSPNNFHSTSEKHPLVLSFYSAELCWFPLHLYTLSSANSFYSSFPYMWSLSKNMPLTLFLFVYNSLS